MNGAIADSLLEALSVGSEAEAADQAPSRDARPTPEQRAVIDRLARLVDARAAELKVSAEILAPRGELKALAMGERDVQSLSGWRRGEIGEKLLEAAA
jgi:ribonuclease D